MARMRTAGPLRDRVTLQKLTESEDAYGDITEAWSDAVGYRIPAKVVEKGARERIEAQAVGNVATHHVYMRYRNDVTPDQRLIWHDGETDRTLNIKTVIEVKRREELDVECEEVVQ